MWLSLFLGYCLFCANWLIFSKLKGSKETNGGSNGVGWHKTFETISSGVSAEAVNYSITLARGIFTIPASLILVKLGYRRACLLAFALTTVALPLIFSPHWTVLILGRFVMAAGGTLTIIYISPLLAKLALPAKKQKLATLNGFTYAISGLIVNVLFIIQPVSQFLVKHWKYVASAVAVFSFLPLILFYLYGENFEIVSLNDKLRVEMPDNYSTLLRDKEAWTWIIAYSGLLVVSILCSNFVPERITELVENIKKPLAEKVDWKSLYTVVFFIGTFGGLYFLGKLNPKEIKRTSIVRFSIATVLFTWVVICSMTLMTHLMKEQTWVQIIATVLIFISAFLLAFFGLGIQSVFLYIPLEYKDYNPKKTSIFFSCLWGIGYIILTGYNVIASVINQLGNKILPTGQPTNGKGGVGSIASLVFITMLLILYYVMVRRIRESKPEYMEFRKWIAMNLFSRRASLARLA